MTVVPMKSDAAFEAHNAKATEAAAKELQNFFADYEALAAQRADVSRDMSDLLTVMKSKGFDVKAKAQSLEGISGGVLGMREKTGMRILERLLRGEGLWASTRLPPAARCWPKRVCRWLLWRLSS